MYRTVEAGKSEEWDLNTMQSRFDIWLFISTQLNKSEKQDCCSLQAMTKTNNIILIVMQALFKWL